MVVTICNFEASVNPEYRSRNLGRSTLDTCVSGPQKAIVPPMLRAFSFLALLVGVAAGMYIYTKQTQAVSPAGIEGGTANPQATIDLAGVRGDLQQFAKAEQQHLAMDGRYLSLEEMRSAGDTGLPADSRGPYKYSIDAVASNFTVTATYAGPPITGVPKAMRIGPDMQISSE